MATDCHFTKKIDPKANIGKFEAIKIEDKEQFNFDYYVHLDDNLPRPVQVLYGTHPVNSHKGNCNGAALLAEGIYPVMTFSNSLYDLDLTLTITTKIPLTELSSGDIVSLPEHSFVFLDHDLSISMNGRGKSLEILKTADILKRYGFPENVLKPPNGDQVDSNHEWKKKIKVIRKKEDWHYPEEIMGSLMVFYSFSYTGLNYMDRSDPYYGRLDPIIKDLLKLILNTENHFGIYSTKTKAAKALYEVFTGSIPGSALRRYN